MCQALKEMMQESRNDILAFSQNFHICEKNLKKYQVMLT